MGFRYATGRLYKPKGGGGWWDLDGALTSCIGAYQAKGVASYADSKIDLSGNGNDLTLISNDPNWSADDGWYYSSGTVGFNTGIIPDGTGNYTIIARTVKAQSANYNYIYGVSAQDYVKTPSYLTYSTFVAQRHVVYFRAGGTTGTYSVGGDVVLALSNNKAYVNGTLTHTLTVNGYVGSGIEPDKQWKVAHTSNDPDWKQYAAAIYNEELDGTTIQALTTAMNAL